MPLSDTQLKNAKAKDKDYRLSDGDGLYLLVTKDGNKWWRFDYTIHNKRKTISFGTYPEVPLATQLDKQKDGSFKETIGARQKRNEAREKIAMGIDVSQERKETKQIIIETQKQKKEQITNQFHNIAYEYLTTKLQHDVADITYKKIYRAIERDILPFLATFKHNEPQTFLNVISSKNMADITQSEITYILKHKSKTSNDTAHRLLNNLKAIYKYAKFKGITNIVAKIEAKDFLPKLNKDTHYASTVDSEQIKKILLFINNYKGSIITQTALKLLPYVCVRVGNLTTIKWADIDFERKIWIVKEHKTSKKVGAIEFPLTDTAIDIINSIRPFTAHCDYIFPQINNTKNPKANFKEPMSTNALSKVFRDNGLSSTLTPHGFRAMFKSLAETYTIQHGLSFKVIEACLFHATEKTSVGRAYGHMADYTDQMRLLMNWWSDWLDSLKNEQLH